LAGAIDSVSGQAREGAFDAALGGVVSHAKHYGLAEGRLRMRPRLTLTGCLLAAALLVPGVAAAATITEFRTPTPASAPLGITSGPDGALWFTEGLGNKIGRITIAGSVTEFPVPTASSQPQGITLGPTGRCGSPNTTRARSDV
jgi:streptogramin lyase